MKPFKLSDIVVCMICIALVTLIKTNNSYALSLDDYYPSDQGDLWTYKETRDGTSSVFTNYIDGYKSVDYGYGNIYSGYVNYGIGDGPLDYNVEKVSSKGIEEIKLFNANNGSYTLFGTPGSSSPNSPYVQVPSNVNIGETFENNLREFKYSSSGSLTQTIDRNFKLTFQGFEDVQVEGGYFRDSLKVKSEETIIGSNGWEKVSEGVAYLAPDIGIVKQAQTATITDSSGSHAENYNTELLRAHIDGKDIKPEVPSQERSMWVWRDDLPTDPSASSDLINFSKAPKPNSSPITTIYLAVNPTLLENNSVNSDLRQLLGNLHTNNIEVHFLAGNRDWLLGDAANPINDSNEMVLLTQKVLTFNQNSSSVDTKFDGIQFDAEPEDTSEGNMGNKVNNLINLLEINRQKINNYNNSNPAVEFGTALAASYGKQDYNGNGTTDDIEVMGKVDYIALMDYRDRASNFLYYPPLGYHEGIISYGKEVVNNATGLGKKVIIGVETSSIQEKPGPTYEYETFYGEGSRFMEAELSKVANEFSTKNSFAGIAFEHYGSYRTLQENPISGWFVYGHSPIDLVVTDPLGRKMGLGFNEIGESEAFYIEDDINGDNIFEPMIYIPFPLTGEYMVSVIPRLYAMPDDTFSLMSDFNGQTTFLANNIRIQDTPLEPYRFNNTVPEPASFFMLGLGLLLFPFQIYKNRKNSLKPLLYT